MDSSVIPPRVQPSKIRIRRGDGPKIFPPAKVSARVILVAMEPDGDLLSTVALRLRPRGGTAFPTSPPRARAVENCRLGPRSKEFVSRARPQSVTSCSQPRRGGRDRPVQSTRDGRTVLRRICRPPFLHLSPSPALGPRRAGRKYGNRTSDAVLVTARERIGAVSGTDRWGGPMHHFADIRASGSFLRWLRFAFSGIDPPSDLSSLLELLDCAISRALQVGLVAHYALQRSFGRQCCARAGVGFFILHYGDQPVEVPNLLLQVLADPLPCCLRTQLARPTDFIPQIPESLVRVP